MLATADASGRVNVAIFGRPHVMEDNSVAFIMPHRLTHSNLQSNSEGGLPVSGNGPAAIRARGSISPKFGRSRIPTSLYSLRRRTYPPEKEKEEGPRFLVFFQVDQVLPVVGAGDPEGK